MIIVKSPREIVLMREAGKIVASVFTALRPHIKPGVTTKELDCLAEKVIRNQGAVPGFLGYGGFPGSICTSINDTLVHGIPDNTRLKEGDIISIDVGAVYKGYNEEAERLVRVTEESFFEAMKIIKPGIHLSDVSYAIQEYCEKHGYSLPRDYTGHGIGRDLHEDPAIPNYGLPGHGPILKEGMCLAIEPMVNQGKYNTKVMSDDWTVKTVDGKLCSHYENTIVVTKDGYEILTLENDNKRSVN